MNNGWVSIHRKLLDWEWFDDSRIVHVFIYCLLKSNHTPKKWRGVQVNRGQFITSVAHISGDLPISTQQVRTALKKLKSTGEITIKTTNKFTMISITNYEDYQDTNKQNNKQITNKQQTNNKQITTNNNDNNDNNEIKKNGSRFAPPSIQEIQNYINEKQYSVDAERFYNFYESKNWMVGKNKMKKWKAAVANWSSTNKPAESTPQMSELEIARINHAIQST